MNDPRCVATALALCLLGMSSSSWAASKGKPAKEAPKRMELKSPAFNHQSAIPKRFTCEGENLSPPLAWSSVPRQAKSLALIVDDPDAPMGTWVHWVIYDIPVSTNGLREGMVRDAALPDGSKQGASGGVDAFDRVGYTGPCPPAGKPHRYFFKLYALKEPLSLPPKATKSQLVEAMKGRIAAQAQLIGTYKR